MNAVRRTSFLSRFALGLVASLVTTIAVVPQVEAQGKKKPAAKDDRAAARQAYNDGTAAYDKGDYAAALENFQKANSIIPSPHALYWIAMSHDKLERKEDAIKSFDELLAHPDVAKIGDDKVATARTRLAALKEPPPAEPAPAPATEPAPAEPAPAEPAPPPEVVIQEPAEPPPAPADDDEVKGGRDNLIEIGLFGGPLFLSSTHNLHEERFTHSEYSTAGLLGLRVGYLPVKYFGIEAEYAHGWGSVETPPGPAVLGSGGDGAQFNTVRGHVIGQYPAGRVVPFALLGAGVLQATSDRLGADGDFLLEGGLGLKVAATKLIMPRLDLRMDLIQKDGGTFSDGISAQWEILLGVSLALGD